MIRKVWELLESKLNGGSCVRSCNTSLANLGVIGDGLDLDRGLVYTDG